LQLRPYYEHLALLHTHYLEVDQLLSGELPSTIVNSFQPGRSKTHGSRYIEDMAEDVRAGDETPGSPAWFRRGSASRLSKAHSETNGRRRSDAGEVDEEVGERTTLLGAEKREERRERIARIALNCKPMFHAIVVSSS
jgi:hypothetical protein